MIAPDAVPNAAVEHHGATKQGEQQRDRGIGHLVNAVVRDVTDPDLPALGRGNIDVIDTDAVGGDHA